MSNVVVGNIYAQIIEKVIQASQVDFEESGIGQDTLAELKKNWQERLTAYKLATFPWDPAPVATTQQPPVIPSSIIPKQENYDGESSSLGQPAQIDGVRIKQEPHESAPQPPAYAHGVAGLNPALAQQRAQTLLNQQYGQQGQQRQHLPPNPQQQTYPAAQPQQPQQPQFGRQQPPSHIQMPGQGQQQRPPQPQYPGQYPQQQRQMNPTQTDGAGDGDWKADLSSRRAISESDRLAADEAMHSRIQRMTHQLDGGLMMPLSEQPRAPRKRKTTLGTIAEASSSAQPPSSLPPQLDGTLGKEEDEDDDKGLFGDEDEEKDEDAINSDLDDSDEEQQAAEDDEEDGAAVNEAILCTYDKVQRVKNKWKCTLKDGVLSTKGKDYLFHKAQGEFEW